MLKFSAKLLGSCENTIYVETSAVQTLLDPTSLILKVVGMGLFFPLDFSLHSLQSPFFSSIGL